MEKARKPDGVPTTRLDGLPGLSRYWRIWDDAKVDMSPIAIMFGTGPVAIIMRLKCICGAPVTLEPKPVLCNSCNRMLRVVPVIQVADAPEE